MNIEVKLKDATVLAKNNEFSEAIKLLKILIPQMANVGGYSHSQFCKVIPYLQKAGRYSEARQYGETTLFEAITLNCQKMFYQRPTETQLAFIHLYKSKVYDKLRLCAKREKQNEDVNLFQNLHDEHFSVYDVWYAKEYET